jgi:ribulose-phosphate 3-epimerase
LIEIDGGVGAHNAAEVYKAGVDVIVAGNAVFSASDPAGMIREIKYANE